MAIALCKIAQTKGIPDGMTIDSEGYIWSARWDGSHVYRYDPDGKEVMRIELPASKISCVSFGGEDYDRLLISSARGDDKCDSMTEKWLRDRQDPSGNLFHLQTGVKGRPELLSRIGKS